MADSPQDEGDVKPVPTDVAQSPSGGAAEQEEEDDDENNQTPGNEMQSRDGAQDQGMLFETEVKEQDRWLPIANVARIMKTALPDNAKIAKEAKECMQECVSEFISFITSEASEKCQQEKRKTVNGEDILFAMNSLAFDNYSEALKIYLARYRDHANVGKTGENTASDAAAAAAHSADPASSSSAATTAAGGATNVRNEAGAVGSSDAMLNEAASATGIMAPGAAVSQTHANGRAAAGAIAGSGSGGVAGAAPPSAYEGYTVGTGGDAGPGF